jgi:hypothetical protein
MSNDRAHDHGKDQDHDRAPDHSHDHDEYFRRVKLAYLLKGSIFTVDDLMPPSSAIAPASRKRQVRRQGRRPKSQ